MAQPVWVLSVDLQTKTATFQSGMAEAARSARGAFQEIKQQAGDMAGETSQQFTNVRASIGLLDNSIRGNHAAAMADLIREFSQTRVVMAALPFAAAAGGLLLLGGLVVAGAQKLREWREQQQQLADDQTKFGTTVQNVFNGLDEKLIQSGIKADELKNDHLGALRLQLQLINKQSLAELTHSFDEVAKGADELFSKLQVSWYQFGIGSAGAKHALDEFQTQHDSLISQGKEKEASGLLAGTLSQAQEILRLQNVITGNRYMGSGQRTVPFDATKEAAAMSELHRLNVGFTQKEVEAQVVLVRTLRERQGIEERVAELNKQDSANAKKQTSNEGAAQRAAAGKEAADSALRMGSQYVSADKATADARLTIARASVAERLASDVAFADREYALQIAANQQQMSALDKSSKDYANQLKAAQDKALELQSEHDAKVAELRARASVEQYQKDVTDLEQSEREKIAATDRGSAERLAAISAAMKAEQAQNLQNTSFYRDLLNQRAETEREMAADEAKQREEAGKLAAADAEKQGLQQVEALKSQFALVDSARRISDAVRVQQETRIANAETAIKLTALQMQANALDRSGKDYNTKLQEIQNKERELVEQHENQITQIKDKAQQEQNQRMLAAQATATREMTQGLSSVIFGHRTMAQMIQQYSQQAANSLMQLAIDSLNANERTKISDAAKAARDAFKSTMAAFPAPFNIVAAPIAGTAAFTTMMGFQGGTDSVPGFGTGDKVPALLEPGEGVVPGGVMDNLRTMAREGRMGGQGNTTHVQVRYTPTVHALDGPSVERVLQQHGEKFTRHFHREVRRGNH